MVASPRVAEPFWREGTTTVFRHGYTYSGHTAACAVGLANLDLIEREGLVGRVRRVEPVLAEALHRLAEHEAVAEVRAGLGLLAAVELTRERQDSLQRVVDAARARGVLLRGLRGLALQISPPFVIFEEEIATLARVLRESLDAVG